MNPEDLLTDTLRDRTDHIDYPSTPVLTVAARARTIRARQRRTTALAAAAAVVAVAVPGVVWMEHTGTTSQHPTHQPSPRPHELPPNPGQLPLGRPPRIDYLHGDLYVAADGSRQRSPVFARTDTAVRLPSGILGVVSQFTRSRLTLVSPGKPAQTLGCGSPRIAMSADGTETASWVADRCTGRSAGTLTVATSNTMGENGPGTVRTAPGRKYHPIGFLPGGAVVVGSYGAAPRGTFVVSPGGTWRRIPGLFDAQGSAQSTGMVTGFLGEDRSTGAVVEASSGAVRWTASHVTLGQFTTDGRLVFGVRNQDASATTLVVFDGADGAVRTSLRIPSATSGGEVSLGPIAWDTDHTVLFALDISGREALFRLDLSGRVTRATPESSEAYRLATRP